MVQYTNIYSSREGRTNNNKETIFQHISIPVPTGEGQYMSNSTGFAKISDSEQESNCPRFNVGDIDVKNHVTNFEKSDNVCVVDSRQIVKSYDSKKYSSITGESLDSMEKLPPSYVFYQSGQVEPKKQIPMNGGNKKKAISSATKKSSAKKPPIKKSNIGDSPSIKQPSSTRKKSGMETS